MYLGVDLGVTSTTRQRSSYRNDTPYMYGTVDAAFPFSWKKKKKKKEEEEEEDGLRS